MPLISPVKGRNSLLLGESAPMTRRLAASACDLQTWSFPSCFKSFAIFCSTCWWFGGAGFILGRQGSKQFGEWQGALTPVCVWVSLLPPGLSLGYSPLWLSGPSREARRASAHLLGVLAPRAVSGGHHTKEQKSLCPAVHANHELLERRRVTTLQLSAGGGCVGAAQCCPLSLLLVGPVQPPFWPRVINTCGQH